MRRAATLGLLLVCGSARANPVDTFGFGGRAPAMGGAQTAATRDGGANYYNPAALALGDDIKIDLGYQRATPYLSLNGGDQGVDQARGIAAAISAPGTIFGVHMALGAGVFLPDERITRTRTLPAQRPRWSLYDNRPQRIFLGSNLAFRINRRVWIGGGIAYMSRTRGTLDLNGRIGFPNSDDSDLALDIDVDLVTVRYPQGGVLVRATPWLDVGLAYRGGFALKLDQAFAIRGDVGPAGVDPVVDDGFFKLHSAALDLFQPEQVALGIAARLTPRLLVAGDVTWQRWSEFQNPAAHIDIEYDLKDFNDLVVIPTAPPLPEAFFHDVIVPRIGVEYTAGNDRHTLFQVRAGYAYEPSPAPEQIGETNFVDNDKHTFSAGLGLSIARVTEILPRPVDFDLYLAATFLPDREHHKLSPTDAIGDYVSSGFVFAWGLASRWHF
jgi:hypothetical protein